MKKHFFKVMVSVVVILVALQLSSFDAYATVKCIHTGCKNTTVSGSSYCSKHKCKKTGCTSKGYTTYNGYCVQHGMKSSTGKSSSSSSSSSSKSSYKSNSSSGKSSYKSSSSSSKSSYKSSSSSKSKREMPDCDDYESYDDFMDDWDGCMPDGSDAGDYWDNW